MRVKGHKRQEVASHEAHQHHRLREDRTVRQRYLSHSLQLIHGRTIPFFSSFFCDGRGEASHPIGEEQQAEGSRTKGEEETQKAVIAYIETERELE